jgi:hypothetical protein
MPEAPSVQAIQTWERHSRQHGSGITAAQLAGRWTLEQLWDRTVTPQPALAASLRLLQAQLQLLPEPTTAHPTRLAVRNSVAVGGLELRFDGWGGLQGRRPLLHFSFESLQLSLGRWRLWQQPLGEPATARRPFFALIATGTDGDGRWLLARGRGGGLAYWRSP